MSSPIIAAQLYTLRDFLKEDSDLSDTFAKVKKAGYDYAQVSGVSANVSASELRKIMLDQGVEPIGAHIGIDAFRGEEFDKTVAYCNDLGIKYAAIPWLDYTKLSDEERAALFAEIEEMAQNFKSAGMTLQYHNHDFEFYQVGIVDGKGGKTLLELLFEACPTLQGEPDFGWVMRGGMDPVLWAKVMAGRMDQVHFKGWGLVNGEFTFRALGQDRINWPAIAAECLKGGTHTFIVEQDSCKMTNDPFKSLAISREYLKTFLG